jgi:hypothetical protein
MVVPGNRGVKILSGKEEEILRAVHFFRYMTVLDVCYFLYSPSVISYVRKILSRMAGGGDNVGNQYLYRFSLPSMSVGNPQRIYTLGSKGRDFLVDVKGMDVGWYFRPYKVKHLSFSKIVHNLFLTRVVVAATRWAGLSEDVELVKVRTCYELGGGGEEGEKGKGGKGEGPSVIPDAWLLFEKKGAKKVRFPVLLEIDRGTAYREKFKSHVAARMAYVRKGGEYSRVFGTETVVIAYATTGESREYMETRRRSMCSWTMEALKERGSESWAPVFRFCCVGLDEVYDSRLFDSAMWYRPDQEKPVRLLFSSWFSETTFEPRAIIVFAWYTRSMHRWSSF